VQDENHVVKQLVCREGVVASPRGVAARSVSIRRRPIWFAISPRDRGLGVTHVHQAAAI